MFPFYYLSVTINLIMGLILVFFDKKSSIDDEEPKYRFLREPTFLLILTIFAGLISVLKMLSPIGEKVIPVLGDLIPVAASICGFFVFLTRYLKVLPNFSGVNNPFLAFFETYENIIGFFCIVAAVAHMLFPSAIFI